MFQKGGQPFLASLRAAAFISFNPRHSVTNGFWFGKVTARGFHNNSFNLSLTTDSSLVARSYSMANLFGRKDSNP